MQATRRAFLALPFLAIPAQAAPAPAGCRTRIADLPLSFTDGYPIVPGTLAGTPVSWLIDTGAQGMLVVPAIADRLNLPFRDFAPVEGTGGDTLARSVALSGLRLGGAPMPDQVAPVVPMPPGLNASNPPFAGLLGASLLSRFDLEFDVAARRITLWSPSGCPPPLAGATLPLRQTPSREVLIPVHVNGQPLLAMVDTGSRATLIEQRAAARLGLHPTGSANTAPGIDGARVPVGHTSVRFGLGNEPEQDTPVSVAPLQLDAGDMLLGLDQLSRRPFWLCYAAGIAVVAAR